MKIKLNNIFLIFLTVLMAVFLYLKPIYAKSGCCSSHGGVCCECGAQSSGKVICNDGWRGSSCYYSEMVKCGGYTAPALVVEPPEPSPYVYNPPSLSPTPQIPSPKPSLQPSPSPKPNLSPSPSPSKISSPSPNPTPEELPSDEPVSSPEIKGEKIQKTEPASTTEALGGLGTMGVLGWGGYKLAKNFLNKKK